MNEKVKGIARYEQEGLIRRSIFTKQCNNYGGKFRF